MSKEQESDKPRETTKPTSEKGSENLAQESAKSKGDLVDKQKKDMEYQKSSDRPPSAVTRGLGRPEIVGQDGELLVKGARAKDSKDTGVENKSEKTQDNDTKTEAFKVDSENRPPGKVTRGLGRPEIVDKDGAVLLKGIAPKEQLLIDSEPAEIPIKQKPLVDLPPTSKSDDPGTGLSNRDIKDLVKNLSNTDNDPPVRADLIDISNPPSPRSGSNDIYILSEHPEQPLPRDAVKYGPMAGRGVEDVYRLDDYKRPIAITSYDGTSVQFKYQDDSNNVTSFSMKDRSGNVVLEMDGKFEYDKESGRIRTTERAQADGKGAITETTYSKDGTATISTVDTDGRLLNREISRPTSDGIEKLGSVNYLYSDANGRPTQNPDSIDNSKPVVAIAQDSSGRVTDRSQFSSAQDLDNLKPNVHEQITYREDPAGKTSTERRATYTADSGATPVSTTEKIVNHDSGNTSVETKQANGVEQSVKFDRDGKATEFTRSEVDQNGQKHIYAFAMQDGKITGVTRDNVALAGKEGEQCKQLGEVALESTKIENAIATKKVGEGFNGVFTSPDGKQSYSVAGGKLYDASGDLYASLDKDGKLHFPNDSPPPTDLNSQLQGWKFQGTENGQPRAIDCSSDAPSGKMFIPDEKTGQPVEYEVRMGMIVNKATGEQYGLLKAPAETPDGKLVGGSVILAQTGERKDLADLKDTVFDLSLTGEGGRKSRHLQGVSMGHVERSEDGTPKNDRGGLFNIQDALDAQHRKVALADAKETQQEKWLNHLTGIFGKNDEVLHNKVIAHMQSEQTVDKLNGILTNGKVNDQTMSFLKNVTDGAKLQAPDPRAQAKPSETTDKTGETADKPKEKTAAEKAAKVELTQLTEDNVSKVNGDLRHGSHVYKIENGQVREVHFQDGKQVVDKEPCGRIGANYTLNLDGQQPIRLASENRVLMQFTVGDQKEVHQVIGLGPGRHTDDKGYQPGGLVEAKALYREAMAIRNHALEGNRDYFASKPWMTSTLVSAYGKSELITSPFSSKDTKGAFEEHEDRLLDFGKRLDQGTKDIKEQTDRLFRDGFNSDNFYNNKLDSNIDLTQTLMGYVGVTGVTTEDLAAKGKETQKMVADSAVMAVTTVATAGAGSIFSAAATAGKMSTGAAYLAELGTGVVAGSTISVVGRASDNSNWQNNALSGAIEGGTMAFGSVFGRAIGDLKQVKEVADLAKAGQILNAEQEALLRTGVGKMIMEGYSPAAVKAAYYSSRVFDATAQTVGMNAAGHIREQGLDHFMQHWQDSINPTSVGAGALWTLAGQGAGHLAGDLAHSAGAVKGGILDRTINDTVMSYTNGGLGAMEGALQAERQRIAQQMGLPPEKVTWQMMKDNVDYSNVVHSMHEAGFSSMVTAPMLTLATHPLHAMAERKLGIERDQHGNIINQIEKPKQPLSIDHLPSTVGRVERGGDGEVNKVIDANRSVFKVERSEDGSVNKIVSSSGESFEQNPYGWSHMKDGVTNYAFDVKVNNDGSISYSKGTNDGPRDFTRRTDGSTLEHSEGKLARVTDSTGITYNVERSQTGEVTKISSSQGESFEKTDSGWVHKKQGKEEALSDVTVSDDGSIKLSKQKGTEVEELTRKSDGTVVDKSGTVVEGNLKEEIGRLQRIADRIPDQFDRESLKAYIYAFREQVPPVEAARTLHEISEIMAAKNTRLSESEKTSLAVQILANAVDPYSVNQGRYPTCNTTTVAIEMYARCPSEAARLVKECITSGEVYRADGQKVTIRTEDMRHDPFTQNAHANERGEGTGYFAERNLADKILQTVLVNAHWQASEVGPDNHGTFAKGKISWEHGPNGEYGRLVADGQVLATSPHLATHELDGIYKQLTGRDDNITIQHSMFQSGEYNRRFGTEDEFAQLLHDIRPSERKPQVLYMNAAGEPFYQDSGMGTAGGSGGAHVVCITSPPVVINGERYVYVDNSWGPGAQHTHDTGKPIKLHDLYLASLSSTSHERLDTLRDEVIGNPKRLLEYYRGMHENYQNVHKEIETNKLSKARTAVLLKMEREHMMSPEQYAKQIDWLVKKLEANPERFKHIPKEDLDIIRNTAKATKDLLQPDIERQKQSEEAAKKKMEEEVARLAKRNAPKVNLLEGVTREPLTYENMEKLSPYFESKEKFQKLAETKEGKALLEHLERQHEQTKVTNTNKLIEQHLPYASRDNQLTERLSRLAVLGEMKSAQDLLNYIPKDYRRDSAGNPLSDIEVVGQIREVLKGSHADRNQPLDLDTAKAYFESALTKEKQADREQMGKGNQVRIEKGQEPIDRSLDTMLAKGMAFRLPEERIALVKQILEGQEKGMVPEKIEGSKVTRWRDATDTEKSLPLLELTKNQKIIDYGFEDEQGNKVQGKISLSVHDAFDHLLTFKVLNDAGMFSKDQNGRGYKDFMEAMGNPHKGDMFNRESELIASMAYDIRAFSEMPKGYNPDVTLANLVENLRWSTEDSQSPWRKGGGHESANQQEALKYLSDLMANDPNGEKATMIRHLFASLGPELREQTRKTNRSILPDGTETPGRLTMGNPEYLALIVDTVRLLDTPAGRDAIDGYNLQVEDYLRGVASGKYTHDFEWNIGRDVPAAGNQAPHVPDDVKAWLKEHPGSITRRSPIREPVKGS